MGIRMSKLIGRLLVVLTFGWVGSVSAIPFEYRADQFSLNGFVEEFDSPTNTFSPWGPGGGGTVNYQDGYAVFTSPGVIQPCGYSFQCEVSSIAYESVMDGSNDYLVQSIWSKDYLAEPPGGLFGQYLYSAGEIFSVSMTNYSQSVATELSGAPGLGVSFARYVSPEDVSGQRVAVSLGDITGDLIFSLAFDSDSQTMSGAFSLDGGQSFRVFTSYESTGRGNLVLYGDPVTSGASEMPSPATIPLLGIGLAALGFSRRKLGKQYA